MTLVKQAVLGSVHRLQVALLLVSLRVYARNGVVRDRVVIGLHENAGMLFRMGMAVPASVTVRVNANHFYDFTYDHDLAQMGRLRRRAWSPWLLGRLAASARAVVYVGEDGFLEWWPDGRAREFRALRRHGVRVVCVFTGTDIRSFARSEELGDRLGMDVLTRFQAESQPWLASSWAESARMRLASAADEHAHAVVNPPVDQISYLQRETHGFLYFYPDELIRRRPAKWNAPERLVVCHAPSSPALKGTPLVRAAVEALTEEGYVFDYVELIGKSNREVLATLERAHIVLNEFYSFVPGVFGVEAMAANAALLTSADAEIEPSLPPGSSEAWVRTRYWEIADRLREVLDDRGSLQAQADRGTEWVREHCASSVCAKALGSLMA